MKKVYAPNTNSRKYLTELRIYCNKIKHLYLITVKLIHPYNKTTHNILQNEIRLTTPSIKIKMWNNHHISIKFHWFSL